MAKGCASFLSGPTHQLTRSLEKILEDAHLSGELRLSGKKLREFPKSGGKYDLSDTVIADLSKNRFWDLPVEVTEFTSLERLEVYHNAIRTLPDSVAHLQSLVHLDLSRNQLSSLPAAVCLLPLQVLLLGHNKLVALPEEMGQLNALMALDVSCNLLGSLPPQLGELTELRSLDVSSNMLNELPLELTYLQLERLDISGNQISALPVELRNMTSLVHLSLDYNPLTSPPAKLCARGRVHVFKYLESKIASDSKKQRNEEWRRTQRKLSDPRGGMRGKRGAVDSGYSTSDNWSQEVLTGAWDGSREHMADDRLGLRSPLLGRVNGSCSISAASTPSSGGSADGLAETDLIKEKKRPERTIQEPWRNADKPTGTGGKLSPDEAVAISNGVLEERGPLEHIQTYREYKEALKSQRAQEGASVYKQRISGDQTPPSPENQTDETMIDGQEAIPASPSNSAWVGNPANADSAPKRPVQKVTPSRNLNLSNGSESPNYTKPASPMNGAESPTTSPAKRFNTNGSFFTPSPARQRGGPRNVRWGRDVPPDKLSFTMRREFEKAREEAELLKQLRMQIETRLKMELPEEMAPSLADGVVLCHLANHVRPRSVASIHVPSPAVPKLTMARCRRNVDNFLEACRKIGVEEKLVCCPADVLEGRGLVQVAITVAELVRFHTPRSPAHTLN